MASEHLSTMSLEEYFELEQDMVNWVKLLRQFGFRAEMGSSFAQFTTTVDL